MFNYLKSEYFYFSACGKTTFVKELLLNHGQRIRPTIQRIVWLYKRWQPLYDDIQKSVLPKVEFIQGIPTDLDDDDYFDPQINNLLILDDLFHESGKDKRITDLFTEGSHHRSLSVITINQNIFGNKDPTQRRNCHYLILYNNPVDRQSLMTLARQMYPKNSDKFLKAFEKATKYCYGYLLVDLKPFTNESERLKYDLDWQHYDSIICHRNETANQMQELQQIPIKGDTFTEGHHSPLGLQTVHFKENSEIENTMADQTQACDGCGLLFDTAHDVQRHLTRGWCPEGEEAARKRKLPDNDGTFDNQPKHFRKEGKGGQIPEDLESKAFENIYIRAKQMKRREWSEKYDEYIKRGLSKQEAKQKADKKLETAVIRQFICNYMSLITYILQLTNGYIHKKVMQKVNALLSQDYAEQKAVKMAVKHYQHSIEAYLDESDTESEESDMESDDESDMDSDDESGSVNESSSVDEDEIEESE